MLLPILKNKSLLFIWMIFVAVIYNVSAQKGTNISEYPKAKLSQDSQREFDYYFYDGISSKTVGKYAATYDYLKYCMRIDSTNANVLFELGNFYASMQKKDDAYKYFAKALKYDPDNFYYNMAFAAVAADKQEFKVTADIYQKLVKENPSKIELYMYLSEAYRLDGDLQKSIDALDDLERTMGMDEKISIQKFKLYSAQNNTKKAYAEVQRYIDKNPNDIRYYILLGNLYLQDGKNKEAYTALTKAKSIDSENPLLITSLAAYYDAVGDKNASGNELRSALFSSKIDADTKVGILAQYIGILQQNKEDVQQINSLFDSLMSEYPQEAKFNMLYGNFLMLQNKKSEANYQYRIFAESDPTNSLGWEQLLQSTDFDSINSIMDVCKSAISYIPEEPLFYFYLSAGQFQNEEYREALKTLNEGIVFVGEDKIALASEFYGLMGNVYHELGVQDSMYLNFEKALQYNPENMVVLNNYAYYLSIANLNLDKAEKMSSITIKAEPTNPTYLDTYGWILFKKGDYNMAKIYLENAVNYSIQKDKEASAEVLEHYGDVLSKMGQEDKAIEYWKQAKEKKSDSKTLDKKIEKGVYVE